MLEKERVRREMARKKELSKKVLLATPDESLEIVQTAFEEGKITEAEFYIAMACIKIWRKI